MLSDTMSFKLVPVRVIDELNGEVRGQEKDIDLERVDVSLTIDAVL